MKKFLGMGALALALAGVPTSPADATGGIKFNLGIGMNMNFEWSGHRRWCGRGCFGGQGCGGGYAAVMPEGYHAMSGHDPQAHAQYQPMPQPLPERRDPRDRKPEDANMQWGYPSLGYSYYHPVSYYQPQYQTNRPAATYYYPQHYYYPANNGYPSHYQAPGITFDR